jgi:hypothetical protein
MSWLDRLRKGQDSAGGLPAKPAEAPSAGSAGGDRGDLVKLSDLIGKATDVASLHSACEEIDGAFARGAIDLETAGQLVQGVRMRLEALPSVPAIDAMPLSEFARSGRCLRIQSRLFDETILLAADNAAIPSDNQLVVYRAAEMTELIRMPETMKRVHMVKKALDGEVIRAEGVEEGGEAVA